MLRIRHCVQCPKCLTLYLVSLSPYRNGSYLIRTNGTAEEYALHCSCSRATAINQFREAKLCTVSKPAYDRGYGAPDEITPVDDQPQRDWSVEVSRYLDDGKSTGKRKDAL
jgi:hypothetical protein